MISLTLVPQKTVHMRMGPFWKCQEIFQVCTPKITRMERFFSFKQKKSYLIFFCCKEILESYIRVFPYILMVVKRIEINLYQGTRVNRDTIDFKRFF